MQWGGSLVSWPQERGILEISSHSTWFSAPKLALSPADTCLRDKAWDLPRGASLTSIDHLAHIGLGATS
jgi:hypothetical protein